MSKKSFDFQRMRDSILRKMKKKKRQDLSAMPGIYDKLPDPRPLDQAGPSASLSPPPPEPRQRADSGNTSESLYLRPTSSGSLRVPPGGVMSTETEAGQDSKVASSQHPLNTSGESDIPSMQAPPTPGTTNQTSPLFGAKTKQTINSNGTPATQPRDSRHIVQETPQGDVVEYAIAKKTETHDKRVPTLQNVKNRTNEEELVKPSQVTDSLRLRLERLSGRKPDSARPQLQGSKPGVAPKEEGHNSDDVVVDSEEDNYIKPTSSRNSVATPTSPVAPAFSPATSVTGAIITPAPAPVFRSPSALTATSHETEDTDITRYARHIDVTPAKTKRHAPPPPVTSSPVINTYVPPPQTQTTAATRRNSDVPPPQPHTKPVRQPIKGGGVKANGSSPETHFGQSQQPAVTSKGTQGQMSRALQALEDDQIKSPINSTFPEFLVMQGSLVSSAEKSTEYLPKYTYNGRAGATESRSQTREDEEDYTDASSAVTSDSKPQQQHKPSHFTTKVYTREGFKKQMNVEAGTQYDPDPREQGPTTRNREQTHAQNKYTRSVSHDSGTTKPEVGGGSKSSRDASRKWDTGYTRGRKEAYEPSIILKNEYKSSQSSNDWSTRNRAATPAVTLKSQGTCTESDADDDDARSFDDPSPFTTSRTRQNRVSAAMEEVRTDNQKRRVIVQLLHEVATQTGEPARNYRSRHERSNTERDITTHAHTYSRGSTRARGRNPVGDNWEIDNRSERSIPDDASCFSEPVTRTAHAKAKNHSGALTRTNVAPHGGSGDSEGSVGRDWFTRQDEPQFWDPDKMIQMFAEEVERKQSQPKGSSAVALRPEFDPRKYIGQVPEADSSGVAFPHWKRVVMAKQLAAHAQKLHDNKLEHGELIMEELPRWKRAIIEKQPRPS